MRLEFFNGCHITAAGLMGEGSASIWSVMKKYNVALPLDVRSDDVELDSCGHQGNLHVLQHFWVDHQRNWLSAASDLVLKVNLERRRANTGNAGKGDKAVSPWDLKDTRIDFVSDFLLYSRNVLWFLAKPSVKAPLHAGALPQGVLVCVYSCSRSTFTYQRIVLQFFKEFRLLLVLRDNFKQLIPAGERLLSDNIAIHRHNKSSAIVQLLVQAGRL